MFAEASFSPEPPGNSSRNTHPAPFTLPRGVATVLLALSLMPTSGQILDGNERAAPSSGPTWGLMKGVGFMVATEVVGVFYEHQASTFA